MAVLYVDIAVGETLKIDGVNIALKFKTGKKARLMIEAPASIKIDHKKDTVNEG